MEIQLKGLNQVYNLLQGLGEKNLPLKTSFLLAKLKSSLETENEFYNNRIKEYIETYAARDEHHNLIRQENGIKLQEDKIQECNEKLKELNTLKVTVDSEQIPLGLLEAADLTFEEVQILLPFISEE